MRQIRARRRRVAVAAALGLAASTLLGVAPSQADTGSFSDGRGETGQSIDVWGVRVDNSSTHRDKVIVTVQQDELFGGGEIKIYLDTQPRNAGPEYLFTGLWESEYHVRRVSGWKGRQGRMIDFRCANPVGDERLDRIRVAFSRRCLGLPGPVRASVRARGFVPELGAFSDWAPRWHRFTPWVRR